MSLKVETINNNDSHTVSSLVKLEKNAFGPNGLSEWEIVPFIRHGLVAALKLDGKVIGSAHFLRDWTHPNHAYLFSIAIDPSYRGKGFGTRFLSDCCIILKQQGINSVELTVDATNHPAVKVYKDKLGFKTTETRIDEYGEGEDRLVMVKAL